MKKGQIFEGVIERVDFPNKGIIYIREEDRYVTVKNGIPGQKVRFVIINLRGETRKADFWKCWKNLRLKQESRSAVFFRPAADACTRPCPMKNR